MQLCNAHRNNQGFTLIETLFVLVIISILAAISAPSFLGMLNKNKINNALTTLQGALQEVQREAIRKSKPCKVYIPDGTQIVSNCFVTADATSTGLVPANLNGLPAKKLDGVSIISDLTTSPKEITFSFRGTTYNAATIVLYMTDGSIQDKKCLVVSDGIGIMRTRGYSRSISDPIEQNYCNLTL
jgi:prepilin-type N-terminal cleavage/methylation domain-containing protein